MKGKAKAEQIAERVILRIPKEISALFPFRGMQMAKVILMDKEEVSPIEPDGKGGHWMELYSTLGEAWDFDQDFSLEIQLLDKWPSPGLTEDIEAMLEEDGLWEIWESLTPKAKREWLRWIRSAKNDKTRAGRMGIASFKLHAGEGRPCCFNSASCTVADLSKGGILIDESRSR